MPKSDDGIHRLDPLEITDWDEVLAGIPNATFFHSSAWARVLNCTYGYRPIYLAKFEGGHLQSLLPLMEVDSWLTGRRGVSLPFTDAAEPLCSDPKSFISLFESALTQAKERKWKYLECRGGKKWMPDAPASSLFWNHYLDLDSDTTALFKRFGKGVRSAVHKSERSGLTVEFSQDLAAMKTFYSLHSKTRKRHGVPAQPFRFFSNIQHHVLEKKLGWIVTARSGQTPVASAIFFHFGKKVIYKFGASDNAFQQLRANNLVLWQAIQWYAKEGFATLDFGRSDVANKGLRLFKQGWGTQEETNNYFTFDCRKAAFVNSKDDESTWTNRVFNLLPSPLSRVIGSVLYRHVG